MALQGAGSKKNLDGLSARRSSLEAASRKSLESSHSQEAVGLANGHQKPEGTSNNPLADVEQGQIHANDNKRGLLLQQMLLISDCSDVPVCAHAAHRSQSWRGR